MHADAATPAGQRVASPPNAVLGSWRPINLQQEGRSHRDSSRTRHILISQKGRGQGAEAPSGHSAPCRPAYGNALPTKKRRRSGAPDEPADRDPSFGEWALEKHMHLVK